MNQFQTTVSGQIFKMTPTSEAEIPLLSNIIETVFHEYSWTFVEADELPDFVHFDEYYADSTRAMLFTVQVSSEHPEIIGCIALKFNAEGPYLSRVYLKESFRGFGLGKWMSIEMMNIARECGNHHIHLWTDTRFIGAHHMYQKVGFTMTGLIRSLHDINNSFEFKMEASL